MSIRSIYMLVARRNLNETCRSAKEPIEFTTPNLLTIYAVRASRRLRRLSSRLYAGRLELVEGKVPSNRLIHSCYFLRNFKLNIPRRTKAIQRTLSSSMLSLDCLF